VDQVRTVIHEIRVYQIELEMQNEELLKTQAELDAARERYFDLYDLAPVAYFTLSDTSVILEANLTAAHLLGTDRRALPRLPLTRFVSRGSQDAYYQHNRRLHETGLPQTCELVMRRSNGTSFDGHLESTLAPGNGGPRVGRTVLTDVTRRKQEELERRRLQYRLQNAEKTESLGRMAAALSHHFNNLLGVTSGNLELALDDLPAGSELSERLTDALDAARLASRVSGMLRTYLGQAEEPERSHDLSAVCRQILPVLRASLPLGFDLDADLPETGPLVGFSESLIEQVLVNLVTNAWEAVEGRRARIGLTVSTLPGKDIPTWRRFPAEWQPEDIPYACLAVTDPGQGIEKDDIEQIFDPFFSSKAFGRGLGLSVVLGSVKAHGGSMVIRSNVGRGTTVHIYLPLMTEGAPTPLRPGPGVRPKRGRGPQTILLVEDEDMVRRVAERMLERLGYPVLAARDGGEAVELFREHRSRIACVLSDITMPGMNGWDTLTALREIDPSVRVILTSGFDRERAMSSDHPQRPQAFISKPWTLDDMGTLLEEQVGRRQPPD
jgi:PAS domain S-box-containing protein